MPAFYKVVNSTVSRASTGRSFIYFGVIEGEPFTIGHTNNLNLKIQKNVMIEAYAKKYKKPASIWVVGTITETFATAAIRELNHALKSAGCSKLNNLDSKQESPDPAVIAAILQTWGKKFKIKSSTREEKRSSFSASDIADYFKEVALEPRIKKLLHYMIENYYQNYSSVIAPMPMFYNGNTDLYRKDLNSIRNIFFTKEGINKYASNNFNMTKPFIEKMNEYMESKKND